MLMTQQWSSVTQCYTPIPSYFNLNIVQHCIKNDVIGSIYIQYTVSPSLLCQLCCTEMNLVPVELAAYAELFKENHITGKRLFLVTMDDLLQIGIFSVGHRRELLVGGVTGVGGSWVWAPH